MFDLDRSSDWPIFVFLRVKTYSDDLEAKQGELNTEISSVTTKIESFEQKFENMQNEIQRLK